MATMPGMFAAAETITRGDTNVELVFGILLFTVAGVGFIIAALFAGKLIRPQLDHPEKQAAYECGEPAIGDSWVQFDLRFYIVALFFIIFDVEIALLWPWAVIYRSSIAGGAGGRGWCCWPCCFSCSRSSWASPTSGAAGTSTGSGRRAARAGGKCSKPNGRPPDRPEG